jgi:PAS domain S-box-containing protein
VISIFMVVPLSLVSLYLLEKNHHLLALRLFMYGAWLTITVSAATSNGVYSTSIEAYPVLIVFAGWLFGPGKALTLAGLTIAAEFSMALAMAPGDGWLPPLAMPPPFWYALAHTAVVVAVTAMGIMLATSYRAHVRKIRALSRELATRLESVAQSESKLRLVTENVPAMIALYDSNMRCQFANNSYAEQFGWRASDLVGHHVSEIIGEDGYHTIGAHLEQVYRNSPVRYCRSFLNREGEERRIDVAMLPRIGKEGSFQGAFVMIQDVTDQARDKDEVRQSEAKFQKIFQASPVAISLTHLDGRYIDVNEAFLRTFGWTRPTIIGRTSLEIGLWPSTALREQWKLDLLTRKSSRDYETEILDSSGQHHSVLVSSETIWLDGEDCILALIFDISERKQAEEEIRHLNAELEDRVRRRTAELTSANKELESFAYSISHDLRAPLRGIDGFSRLLQEDYGDRLDAQGQDYLSRVRRAAQRLGTLINHMLELSLLTRKEMRSETLNLTQIGREIIDDLRRSDPERTVEVVVGADCAIRGDPQMLRVLLENLLHNAWKYTNKVAAARIEFGGESAAAVNHACQFFVRDNGVGFDMAYADRLFSPFQRLHTSEQFDGTGIGLASAGRVVQRHGGRIWAESVVGQGTTFRFALPDTTTP